jgi:hypothetical protein
MIYLGTFSATSASYPGDKVFTDFVVANCPSAFQTYVGHSFASDKTYDVNWLVPTETGWAKGDRAINCFVVRLDGKPITTGSVRAR